jgi:hypothetical protein
MIAMDNDHALTPGNADPSYRAALEAKGVVFENEKARRILGINFRDKDETLKDAALAIKGTLLKQEAAEKAEAEAKAAAAAAALSEGKPPSQPPKHPTQPKT